MEKLCVCVCVVCPRLYGQIMEGVQEACHEMGGVKRAVSEWAMKKGLEGNIKKQSK